MHRMKTCAALGAALTAGVALGGHAAYAQDERFADADPIVFVHGDSDTAALWIAQIWRFESNGFPREKLIAIDLDHPGARNDNTVPEENRSSTFDVATQLRRDVEAKLSEMGTGETASAEQAEPASDDAAMQKIDIVGNSRGCQTIRNYLRNFGGADRVDTAVLTGCVHHGVWNNPDGTLGSEYNGQGYFLQGLNEGHEVEDGVTTVTIRSDEFDLYNQPMGDFIGFPGVPIGGAYDGGDLEGADNQVIEGADHRETAYSEDAFRIMYRAITGEEPKTVEIEPEAAPVLNGEVSGWDNERPTNLPIEGATVRVFATDAETGERMGEPVHQATVGADGMWGPFTADPEQAYEFEIEAEGYPTHHIYRSAFPRSFDEVNLRLYPKEGAAAESTSHISMMRPRGYFGTQDELSLGEDMQGMNEAPVPNVWKVHAVGESEEQQTVTGSFNGETITARSWPSEGHTAWIELTY